MSFKADQGCGLNLIFDFDFHGAVEAVAARFGFVLAALQPADFGAKSFDLHGNGGEGLGERIIDLFGISDDYPLAMAQNDVSGHTDDGGIGWNAAQYYGTGADAAIRADGD